MFSVQVVSNENENLTITAKKISVDGHEGVFFDGKMLMFDVERDVSLSSNLVGKIDELIMRAHLKEVNCLYKQTMFLSHAQKPEVKISHARTILSPRLLN